MTLNELEPAIREWLEDRMIFPNSSAQTQCMKAVSEMGELADAIIKNDRNGAYDAIGDVAVCLIAVSMFLGFTFEECLEFAYNQIKNRKGRLLPNGVFVKEVSE
jgi:NTP pyrophosphatase (non-canonical NTP hydrolase)